MEEWHRAAFAFSSRFLCLPALASQMHLMVYSSGRNTCTLQTGGDKRTKTVSENLELVILGLTLIENFLYKIQKVGAVLWMVNGTDNQLM